MGNNLPKYFIILNIINAVIKLIKCFNKSSSEDISLCMVGDLLIHLPILDYAKTEGYNFDFIFENMEKYIKEYDIKIINEEVLISGSNFSIKGYPRFNSPFELADSVVKAGFNVILKSTNHVNDFGEKARLLDLNYWKKFPNIKVTGSYQNEEEAQKITYFETKGIKIALLNYCYGSNRLLRNSYTINKIKYDKIKNDIKKSKSEGADIIIVMPHWGKEYSLKSNIFQNKWSKIFFELGVDIIIGTHPHVIEPVKIMEDKDKNRKMYIFYSLGNFISSGASRKKNVFLRYLGGMAHIIIGKKNNKVIIKEVKFIPLITHIYPENKKVTTFKVKDYNENMAKNNYVGIRYDKTFSYDNMMDIFKNTIDKNFLDFDL